MTARKKKVQLTIPGIEESTKSKADKKSHLLARINSISLKLLYPFIGLGDTRPHLRGINVRPLINEEGILIAATDGHKMLMVKDGQGMTEKEIILRIDKEALLHTKASINLNVMSNGQVLLLDEQEQPVFIQIGNSLIEGDFPRVESIVNTKGYHEGISGAVQLNHLRAALKIDHGGYIRFWSKPQDSSSPLIFKLKNISGLEILGAIIKDHEPIEPLPNWFPREAFKLTKTHAENKTQ